VQEAQAYRAQRIANAEGEADRFMALLTEYERAPGVTRERLYLETIERVLASSKKIVLDTPNGNGSLIYLPIDKLLEQSRRAPRVSTGEPSMTVESTDTSDVTSSGDRRTRGTR
jgi:membrane protease subunit HflK